MCIRDRDSHLRARLFSDSQWSARGHAVWTPAELEQAKQRRQKSKQAALSDEEEVEEEEEEEQEDLRAAASSSDGDQFSTDSAVDSAVAGASAHSSDSDSDSLPPQPTLIDCGENLAKYEVKLAQWEEKKERALARAQRRARAPRKEDGGDTRRKRTTQRRPPRALAARRTELPALLFIRIHPLQLL